MTAPAIYIAPNLQPADLMKRIEDAGYPIVPVHGWAPPTLWGLRIYTDPMLPPNTVEIRNEPVNLAPFVRKSLGIDA